jgi:hypothetical protein
MARNEKYDVKVTGRRTDDQGRTIVQETFWYKGSFYMSDRYERADESNEKKLAEDAVSAPPNPARDEPAMSTAEVPTLIVETKSAVNSPAETAVAAQPVVTREAEVTPDVNHTCVQLVEWTEGPTDVGADSGHKEPAAPTTAGTDSADACGSKRSQGALPVSPKGGQRRPPRTGTQRKHSPRSRRPRCRRAGMCCSPRSCYEAFLHTTEFGQLLDPNDVASWCYVCARCSTNCGYESVPSSPPVKDVPGIRPDKAPDELGGLDAVPEEEPHAQLGRALDPPIRRMWGGLDRIRTLK